MKIVDLRSDTVTKPTPGMLEAMMKADVGDDVYGEDPTITSLERKVAAHLGHEAGLFVPSGTMANQIAIHVHTRHGDTVLAEEDSHVYLYEAGAAAAQSGIQFDLIPFSEHFSDQAIDHFVKPESIHYASTKLVVVENTHNRGLGRVLPPQEIRRILAKAKSYKLSTHCDGARVWNAAAALSCHEAELTKPFDSVSVCFSKGLGAPVGSVLVGPQNFIDRARKIRKRWGGGMRQAGYLAAGALYAFDHHRSRLKDDHKLVSSLYEEITQMNRSGLPIEGFLPELSTNILYFKVPDGDLVSNRLRDSGILINHLGHNRLRAVTHLQVDHQGIERTLSELKAILKKFF